jgi:hypothetical protein
MPNIELLQRVAKYLHDGVRWKQEGHADDAEPATEHDHALHDLACELSCEIDRLMKDKPAPGVEAA